MSEISRKLIDEMRAGRAASSSIFMDFASYKNCFNTHAFCFYEGEDGKYYDNRIRNVIGDKFIHLKAGNKNAVLHTMKLIKEKHEYDGVDLMFFVDRDMDFKMEEYNNKDVYVTPCYSIENLYVCEESFGKILETEFGLNVTDSDYKNHIALFNRYYDSFCSMIFEYNALVYLKNKKKLGICIDVNTNHLVKIDIGIGVLKGPRYDEKIDGLKKLISVTGDEIETAKNELKNFGEIKEVFRGKNQFDFMIQYLELLSLRKNILFEKELNAIYLNQVNNRLSSFSGYAKTPDSLIVFLNRHKISTDKIS
ncbi:MAG: DUF4435 domain-containing protein [Acholeplasmatales bacterium]|nr:DUF4435 domain-containing protein [Acholeplasmatales bacterium]